jgi:hypothetical protein
VKKPKEGWPPPELTLPSLEVLERLSCPQGDRRKKAVEPVDKAQTKL